MLMTCEKYIFTFVVFLTAYNSPLPFPFDSSIYAAAQEALHRTVEKFDKRRRDLSLRLQFQKLNYVRFIPFCWPAWETKTNLKPLVLLQTSRSSSTTSPTSSAHRPYSQHPHRHHRRRDRASQRGVETQSRIARYDERPPPPPYQTLPKLPHLPGYTEVDVSLPPPPYTEKQDGR